MTGADVSVEIVGSGLVREIPAAAALSRVRTVGWAKEGVAGGGGGRESILM